MTAYQDERDYVFQDAVTDEWFFLDESEDVNGPYYTEEAALAALDAYMEYLNGI